MAQPTDVYTHGHHDAVLRSHRWRTAANSAGYLLAHLEPGLNVLDVGCGPGTLTVDLARQVAPGRVLGIDRAAEVVEQAEEHAREAGVDNVSFRGGDFRDLDAEESPFDVDHAHQVLQHLGDPVGALAAMARLARPGGLVAVRDSDYSAMTWAPDNDGLDRWLEVYLAVTRHNHAEARAGRYLVSWAREAGLADVTYTTSTWTFATLEERAWWGDLWAERVVASTLADQAVAYGIADTDEFVRHRRGLAGVGRGGGRGVRRAPWRARGPDLTAKAYRHPP